MQLHDNWFTEVHAGTGTAFSLKIKEKLHSEQTPYQKIEIFDTESFGYLMVIDDCTMVSSRDNFYYHEMMSHPVIFTHQTPKKVWIIGGGDCGVLKEVLKHKEVEYVIQVDIDERVTRLSELYFPELCESNQDPRVQLKYLDGIEWLKKAEEQSVDIIIIDSTDPIGPAEGLFNESFYRDCLKALTANGIIMQQSESPLLHNELMDAMRSAMHNAGFKDVKRLFFPQCIYPSGWWSATMAGKKQLQCFRERNVRGKQFATRYYNAGIHQAAFACPEFLKNS